MIKTKLSFTIDEAVQLFREAGLTVERRIECILFIPKHRPEYWGEVATWIVLNPYNGKEEKLEEYFLKFIQQKKSELFLSAEKLEIFNLFDK